MAAPCEPNAVSGEMSKNVDKNCCGICQESLCSGVIVSPTEKGIAGLNSASSARNEDKTFHLGQSFHQHCRYDYCNKNTIKRDLRQKANELCSVEDQQFPIRSKVPKFSFDADCLFCGLPVKDESKRKNVKTYPIRTFSCQESLLEHCRKRGPDDKWAQTVHNRIEFAQDLHAVDAVYHNQCNINFRTNKSVPLANRHPSETQKPETPKGRPEDPLKAEAFLEVINYFNENDDEQKTISDLCKKMEEYLNGETPYTEKYMRIKLLAHFGDQIVITCIRGKRNVVTHRSTAEKIIERFSNYSREQDKEKEKIRIIETVAKLLLLDIKNIEITKEDYPSSSDIGNLSQNLDFIPPSLQQFLEILLQKKNNVKLKTAALGQSLMQAARPKVLIAPLQIGLGVSVHHLTGSRHLVDQLCSLGFSSSYDEVKTFELSASLDQKTELDGVGPNSVIQFMADNVDHQIRTLDGTGTFHGMGMLAASTPGFEDNKTIRRQSSATPAEISAIGKVPIHYFCSSTNNLNLTYGVLKNVNTDDKTWKLDLLWKLSWPCAPHDQGGLDICKVYRLATTQVKAALHFYPS